MSLSQTSMNDGKRLDSIRSEADIEADLKMIYGEARLGLPKTSNTPSPPPQERGELNVDLLVDKLRHMSHLSTITENR